MYDYAERYGHRFVKLTDSRATEKEFEFDQMLLMPTARGRRALVEQAKEEISPMEMRLLSRRSKLCCGARFDHEYNKYNIQKGKLILKSVFKIQIYLGFSRSSKLQINRNLQILRN